MGVSLDFSNCSAMREVTSSSVAVMVNSPFEVPDIASLTFFSRRCAAS